MRRNAVRACDCRGRLGSRLDRRTQRGDMSNDAEETQTPAEEPQAPPVQADQAQEWEAMAHAWLRAFPEAKAVSNSDVEAWIDVNRSCLPSELKSMARSELIERLLSIQNILRLPAQVPPAAASEKETASQKEYPYRFQRTNQWLPVYTWLESLDTADVVNSNEIADWLTSNPEIRDVLSAKHSKYHLTHYIKKCHMKILKRKEKKKVTDHPAEVPPINAGRSLSSKQLLPIPYNPASNIPKDSELYVAKRNEAVRKYEILVAFEKQLLTLFPRN